MDADVVIIGAGAIGLAIGERMSSNGYSVVMLEKEKQYGSGVSSRNTEIIHAGIYYKAGSLKASLCVKGKEMLYGYCAKNGVKHRKIGKLFIAVNTDEIPRLELTKKQALENGIEDLAELDRQGLNKIEPGLNAAAALFSPSSGIVDSHGFMQSLFKRGKAQGMILALDSPFASARYEKKEWVIKVGGREKSSLKCRVVINSAGLYAVSLSRSIFPERNIPDLYPTKGNYLRLSGKSPVNHIVYPAIIPGLIEERVDAVPDLGGSLRFGPDVDEARSLEDFEVNSFSLQKMAKGIKRYFPKLDIAKLHLDCSGIRPKIYGAGETVKDFIFDWAPQRGWLDLWGMESPGLTASLAIAEHVNSLVKEKDIL